MEFWKVNVACRMLRCVLHAANFSKLEAFVLRVAAILSHKKIIFDGIELNANALQRPRRASIE